MTRISWQDAYPDHPDKSESRTWLTIETDDSLWDVPCEVEDFPTRPSDMELTPSASIYLDEYLKDVEEERKEREARAAWKKK